MSNGFLIAWTKAKISRGKKLLIIVKTKLGFYPAYGKVQGDSFIFYDRETKRDSNNKIPKRLKIPSDRKSPFFRLFNIWVCFIDESTNSFTSIRSEGDAPEISGFDPILQESLIMRALSRPTFEQKKTIFFVVIIIFLVILFFMMIFLIIKVTSLPQAINVARGVAGQMVSGVNV
jgi:hypothetical protein